MEALILLVPLSLVAVGVAVAIFFRMNGSGQFDDDVGPAWSVLMDDDRAPLPPTPEEGGEEGDGSSSDRESTIGSGDSTAESGRGGTSLVNDDPRLP